MTSLAQPTSASERRTDAPDTIMPAPETLQLDADFRERKRAHLILLVALPALVFLNTMDNSLHLDDFYRVKDNPGIQRFWPPWRHIVDPSTMAVNPQLTNYRPLLPLSLSINYAIAKDSHAGYHLGNLLIHVAAVILVYLLCLELLAHWSPWCSQEPRRSQLAFAVAAVFAIHPLSGILINYICSRDLSMMQAFSLASLLAYVRTRRLGGTVGRWAWIVISYALAMLSKTSAVVMPGLILLFEFVVAKQRPWCWRPWLRVAPFVIVIFIYFAYTKGVLHFSDIEALPKRDAHKVLTYALTQARLHLFQYGANFLWPLPIRLAPSPGPEPTLTDPGALAGLAFILGTLIIAWRAWRACPLISFGILAYWVCISPESSFIPMFQPSTHYRPYPGSPFAYLAVGLPLCHYLKPRHLRPLFYALITYLGICAIWHNTTWRTEKTLWAHTIKYGGDALAHLNYALTVDDLQVRKQYLEEALRLAPNYVFAEINLGMTLIAMGQPEEGLRHVEYAARIAPTWAQPHYWLGEAYGRLGRNQEAAREAVIAARIEPRDASYQYGAALRLQLAGDVRASLPYAKRLADVNPGYKDILFLQGFARQQTGDKRGAVEAYRAFLKLQPNHDRTHFNLGFALKDLGDYQGAIASFQKALSLNERQWREAYRQVAYCYKQLGNLAAAHENWAKWQALAKPAAK